MRGWSRCLRVVRPGFATVIILECHPGGFCTELLGLTADQRAGLVFKGAGGCAVVWLGPSRGHWSPPGPHRCTFQSLIGMMGMGSGRFLTSHPKSPLFPSPGSGRSGDKEPAINNRTITTKRLCASCGVRVSEGEFHHAAGHEESVSPPGRMCMCACRDWECPSLLSRWMCL